MVKMYVYDLKFKVLFPLTCSNRYIVKFFFVVPRGGGHLNDKRGYQARPWTHKKHPKHVFLGLKFASLNKYSSGI